MNVGRVVGLDPGTVRVGVAVSDRGRTVATARPALRAGEHLVDEIRAVVGECDAALVVVGRPVSLAGRATASTRLADELCATLQAALAPVTVVAVDERLTTVTARKHLSDAGRRARDHRSVIDSEAAAVLLQQFLDATPR